MDYPFYYMPLYSPESGAYPQPGPNTWQQVESRSKNLLIVEDEQSLCDLLVDILEGEGHQARKAPNGQVALTLISERTPDLIFLDMMMPVMDGWQFLTELRKVPEWVDIPVVLMTAVYDLSNLEKKTGARAVLSKPFDIELIIEAVGLFAR